MFDSKCVEVSLLFDMNSERSVLFGSNSRKMPLLFGMNSEKVIIVWQ